MSKYESGVIYPVIIFSPLKLKSLLINDFLFLHFAFEIGVVNLSKFLIFTPSVSHS
jgi:hypothetical protein